MFKHYSVCDGVVDSYDQLIDELQNIIQKFDLIHSYVNKYDQLINVRFDVGEQQIQKNDMMSYVQCTNQRQSDYTARFTYKTDIKFMMWKEPTYMYKYEGTYLDLPIVTGCKLDKTLKLSKRELWDNCDDVNQQQGDLVFKGNPYLVQNERSQPYNRPIITENNKFNQIVGAGFLRQTNPVFGNIYYNVFLLMKYDSKNVSQYDIALSFRQAHDKRFVQKHIPIFLLFKVYGMTKDEDIINLINMKNDQEFKLFLIDVCQNGPDHREILGDKRGYVQRDAIKLLGDILMGNNYDHDIMLDGLDKYIAPLSDSQQQLQFMAEIVSEMYYDYKYKTYSDRDDFKNARGKAIGPQVVSQIRSCMSSTFGDVMRSLDKDLKPFKYEVLKENQIIEAMLGDAMRKFSELLSRALHKSFATTGSQMDKQTGLEKNLNELKTRQLDHIQKREIVIKMSSMGGRITWDQCKVQKSYIGMIDPMCSPESGSAVGRYLNPTLYTHQTISQVPTSVIQYMEKYKDISKTIIPHSMSIKVNGVPYAFIAISKFKLLYTSLMKWRADNAFKSERDPLTTRMTQTADQLFTSIYYCSERKEICINTENGRFMNPIINGSWDEKEDFESMVQKGKMTFICAEMLQNFVVNEYDASVKDGQWMFLPYGMVAIHPACAPLINRMKSIRQSYAFAQWKQFVAIPYSNFMCVTTNSQLVSHTMQFCPLDTAVSRVLYNTHPYLNLMFVTFMPFTKNQEDAIVSNDGYFSRGGANISQYKTYSALCETDEEQFRNIPHDVGKGYNYKLINKSNFIPTEIGLNVALDDVLITKVMLQDGQIANKSEKFDLNYANKYTVTSNVVTNMLNNKVEKLTRCEQSRVPLVGDKYVSRNAQKGTLGAIMLEYLLPMFRNGIIPTFTVNSPSILKRETYSQQMEAQYGRYLIDTKQYFTNVGISEMNDEETEKLAYVQKWDMIGRNGTKIRNKILGGPLCYGPQKHLVAAKLQSRSVGPINKVTRQPMKGKKFQGGMRVGNLEQGVIACAGCANLLRYWCGEGSQNTQWYICKQCGQSCVNQQKGEDGEITFLCQRCGKTNDVQMMGQSFQPLLFEQILWGSGMQIKYQVHKENDEVWVQ